MTIDSNGMYLVEWPDGSKRLLFGHRLILNPTGSDAIVTPLAPAGQGLTITQDQASADALDYLRQKLSTIA